MLIILDSSRVLEHPVDRHELGHHQLPHTCPSLLNLYVRRVAGSELIGINAAACEKQGQDVAAGARDEVRRQGSDQAVLAGTAPYPRHASIGWCAH
jgi:hypothetical protein